MRVTVAGVEFSSPVIAASGTFGYGVEFEDIIAFNRIGGFVTKGLSREPMVGNPAPRIIETAAGMVNAIGLQNMGVRPFIAEKLPKLQRMNNTVVIANGKGFLNRSASQGRSVTSLVSPSSIGRRCMGVP